MFEENTGRWWKVFVSMFLAGLLTLTLSRPAFAYVPPRADRVSAVPAAAVPGEIDPPTVTLSVPPTAMIGANVTFTVTFDNNDPEGEVGYGPFIDLEIPTIGADGAGAALDDGLGLTTITATYLGAPIPAQDFFATAYFNAGGTATHPFARDASGNLITVTGTPGNRLVVIRLPFGSFTVDQPPATVSVTVDMSNLADAGFPLAIRARGGYQYGFTPLDDWCCGDPASDTLSAWTSQAVTPTVMTFAKSYAGPGNVSAETATGPNFTRQYTITVDIATGQPISGLTVTDELDNNQQYVPSAVRSPAGSILVDEPVGGAAQNPPNNDLVVRWDPTVIIGGAGATDASVSFSFFIPRDDANGARVINPLTGDAVSSCNQARVSGLWTPLDTRDAAQTITLNPPGCEHVLADRSIATQKSVTVLGGGQPAPGRTLVYTLEVQVSDFFAFDGLTLTDVISDGQSFDAGFVPQMSVNGNGFSLGAANMAAYAVLPNKDLTDGPPPPPAENPATDGTTTLTFNISTELSLRAVGLPAGTPDEVAARNHALAGRLLGGCVPLGGSAVPDCGAYNDGGTTVTIVFRTVVDENFTDDYPSGDWSVDQGDVLKDAESVRGNVLDTASFVPTGFTEEDDAVASVSIGTGALTKSIYAINGILCPDAVVCPGGGPYRIKPGDTVTYRMRYQMPTSDVENLEFADFLPFPIFFVADPDANDYNTLPPPGAHNDGPAWVFTPAGQSGQPPLLPAPGNANFGPADTFYNYSSLVPVLGSDPVNNLLTFTYGDFDDPRNQSTVVDLLFTLTVATEPFADGLYLTNQAHAYEGSTNAGMVTADAIVQLILTEPVLNTTKGVIWTSSPDNVFIPTNRGPAGVTFLAPGSAPRWTGTINSAGLSTRPINSNVRDVDAGDTVTFAITIENRGTSLKGAFDIQIKDILQSQYQIPAGGLNLQVYYGNGAGPIPYRAVDGSCTVDPAANNDPCGLELFEEGLELIDPIGVGVCQAHDPNLGNNVILITYDLQLRPDVAPGDILNTETLLRYAGEEGGPNHVPTPSPETDTAVVTVSGAPLKYLASTSEAHTTGSRVAVGEVIRYRIVARIPESTSVNYQLTDLLPNGLLFLDDGTARIALISDNGLSSTGVGIVPAIPAGCNLPDLTNLPPTATDPAALPCLLDDLNIGSSNSTSSDPDSYASGTDVYFKLGNLINSDTDDDGEFAVIEFNVLVHNQTTHQNNAGSNRDNFVRAYAGSPLVQIGSDSPAVRVTVVEPSLTLDKTHSAIGVTVDAGDTVTYTVTLTNPGGSNSATAFDVDFTDTLPATYLTLLDTSQPANFSIVLSGGASGATNLSAGNTVHVTVDSMPVGSQVVITYKATVTTAVTPSQAIDNTGQVTWTSLPGPRGTGDATPGAPGSGTGERDGSGGIPITQPNDQILRDVATLDIHDPLFSKTIERTSATHTVGPDLVIGEVVTFGLYVTLPEGTTPSLRVFDNLPGGLAYIMGSAQVITQTSPPATCGSLAEDFNGTLPAPTLTVTPPGGGSGADLTFDFGTITVNPDASTANNSFLICFEAVLLNEAGNQASPPPLTNTAVMTVSGTDYFATRDVTVVEPKLRITKSVDDDLPAPGQTITFTVVVDHDPTSGADAFDAYVEDILPAGLDLLSVTAVPAGGVSGVTDLSDLVNDNVVFTVDVFPRGGSLTLTYQALVTAPFGSAINNIARTTWTSLPGTDANERTGADGPGGALNDYAATSAVAMNADRNLTKSLVATDHGGTAGTDVTIGEILTYELTLTIPAASTDTYLVTDTLDAGLAFVDCADITGGADLSSSRIPLNVAGNCNHGPTAGVHNPLISGSGTVIAFDFGTIANTHPTNAETIVIRYRAVVLDVTTNVRSVTLDNSARMEWSLGSVTRTAGPVTILEPDLNLEKTVSPPFAIPGQGVLYRVRVFHTGVSQLDAYDAIIRDVLPAGVAYIPGSLRHVPGSGPAPDVLDDTQTDPVTGRRLLRAVWNTLPFSQESMIEFAVTLSDVPAGTVITNTASVEWTSLPGDVPAPPATYLSAYEPVNSHERRYDPLNPADVYRVQAAAALEALELPKTGFAPDRITALPEQPSTFRYVQQGDMWLEIPSLGVSATIVGVPINEQGWNLTWLGDQAGYLEGTAYPGWPGNTALTAHVYLPNGKPGPFVQLHTLRWGDRVILHAHGQRYVYEVRSNRQVRPDDLSVLRHEEYSWLTLITCRGYNETTDNYRYRQVVRAVLIAVEPEQKAP